MVHIEMNDDVNEINMWNTLIPLVQDFHSPSPLDITDITTASLQPPDPAVPGTFSLRVQDGTEIGIKRPMERPEFTAGL